MAHIAAAVAIIPLAALALAAPSASAKVTSSPSSTTTGPLTVASSSSARTTTTSGCTVSAILVPSCGAWWGVSPGGSQNAAQAVADFERVTGTRTDIYHGYHQIGDLFPTATERGLARDPAGKRLLMLNLMPTTGGQTWAQITAGAQDTYLAQLATYIKTNFPEKFFMTVNHEPDHSVDTTAGSGMQATDFAAMFRHVVTTMRSHGVNNVVWVVTYQGTQKWKTEPWWPQLYPGDDVVDWIGWDSYSCVNPAAGQPCIDFGAMMNRRFSTRTPWQGMYQWATSTHPDKPIFVAELGVWDVGGTLKADALRTVGTEAPQYPAIKAMCYWNSTSGTLSTEVQVGQGAAAAAAQSAQSSWFSQSVP